MSKQWQKRPSEIYDVTNPLDAYWFDRAVMYFGTAFEADIEDATADAKTNAQAERAAQVVRDRWLRDEDDTPQESTQAPKSFRDPAEVFAEMKRMRADGQL